jgi:hypothetical protein
VLCSVTAGRFECADYSMNSVLPPTADQRQHAERNQQIKQCTYQISYNIRLVNLTLFIVNDVLKICVFILYKISCL